MKTWTLTLAAATLLAGVPALAQETTPEAKPTPAKPEAKKDGEKKTEPRRTRRTRRNRWSPVNYLKDRLKLTEEQIPKLEAFYEERGKARRAMWQKMRKEGRGFDYQGAMKKAREGEDAKLKLILNDEQMKKYFDIRKKQEERSNRWRNRGRRGRNGQNGNTRRGGWGMKDRALRALKLDDETKAVMEPIVDKVVKKLNGSRSAWGKFRRATRELKDEEKLKAAIATYRKERDAAREELKTARAELTELLTPTQEAALIRLGLLD